MITHLDGTLEEKAPTRVVVDVGGVGYEVLIPLSSYDHLPAEGERCRLLAHHHVREDAQILYGFLTEKEREAFRLLLTVSGIGPKLALSCLSGMSVRELKAAVVEGNVKRISSISGIGKKTAERMVVELKDKLSAGEALEALAGEPEAGEDASTRDAVLALISLGYKQADAYKMIRTAREKHPGEKSVEELVRRALGG